MPNSVVLLELNSVLDTFETHIVCALLEDPDHPMLRPLRKAYLAVQKAYNTAEELELRMTKGMKSRGPG